MMPASFRALLLVAVVLASPPALAQANGPDYYDLGHVQLYERLRSGELALAPLRGPQVAGPLNCELRRLGDGRQTLSFSATCNGSVSRYAWRVNGQPNIVSAPSLYFPPAQVAGVRSVEVVATTDRGQTASVFYSMVTGVTMSTP